MERRALLRASDADREQVAERLRLATSEGRLTPDELEDRLRSTYRARTYGQLDELVGDLPASAPPAVRRRGRAPVWRKPTLAVAALAVLLSTLVGEHHHVEATWRHHHVFVGGTPLPHLLAFAADAVAGVLLVLVLTALAAWALVRRLGRLI